MIVVQAAAVPPVSRLDLRTAPAAYRPTRDSPQLFVTGSVVYQPWCFLVVLRLVLLFLVCHLLAPAFPGGTISWHSVVRNIF